jgi:hypothetical protein
VRGFENRVLRRIFESKRDEVTGEWRKLLDEKLKDLYFSLNTFRGIKSRKMRCAGHVACMGERRIQGFSGGKLSEKDYLEDPGVDVRKILRWFFIK